MLSGGPPGRKYNKSAGHKKNGARNNPATGSPARGAVRGGAPWKGAVAQRLGIRMTSDFEEIH